MIASQDLVEASTVAPIQARDWYRRVVRVERALVWVIRLVLGLTLVGDLIIVLANIFSRELLHHAIEVSNPISGVALLILGYLGGAVAFCDNNQITVDFLVQKASERTLRRLLICGEWLAMALGAVTFVWAVQSYHQASQYLIYGLSLSQGLFAIALAVAMGLIAVDMAVKILGHALSDNLVGMAVLAAAAVVTFVGAQIQWISSSPDHVLIICTVLGLAVIVAGMPITIGVLLFVVVYIISGHNISAFLPLNLEGSLTNYVLLAIPFFILSGYIMTEGGLGRAIVRLLAPIYRRVPGGNIQLSVGTMFVFSGMTGSKLADVTAVATAMTDSLVEEGYPRGEIACVLAACTSAGETIPPSIALLLLATIINLGVVTLFLAGIFPALFIGLMLTLTIMAKDRFGALREGGDRRAKQDSATFRGLFSEKVIWRCLAAFGLPVVLLTGLETGYFTPTESAAVAVLYALLAVSLFKPRLGIKSLWKLVERSAAITGLLLLLITIATAVATAAVTAEIPQELARDLDSLGKSPGVFLVISVLVLPLVGIIFEGLPALLIFAPIFFPTAASLGVNLIQYGIVFTLALALGAFSPYLGVGFYTVCKIVGVEISTATRRYMPYFCALVGGVLIVAFVPEISLWLPKALHLAGS